MTGPLLAAGGLWVPRASGGSVVRFDPSTGQVIATIPVVTKACPKGCQVGLGAGDDAIWAAVGDDRALVRIDPTTNEVVARHVIAPLPFMLAVGHDAVWVTSFNNDAVVRLDPSSGEVVATLPYRKPFGVALTDDAVWVVLARDNQLVRIDRRPNQELGRTQLPGQIPGVDLSGGVAAGAGSVWTVTLLSATTRGAITRVDPQSGAAVATIPLDGAPAADGPAAGPGTIWAASESGRLWRIDASTNQVTRVAEVGRALEGGLAVEPDGLWMTSTQPSAVLKVAPPS